MELNTIHLIKTNPQKFLDYDFSSVINSSSGISVESHGTIFIGSDRQLLQSKVTARWGELLGGILADLFATVAFKNESSGLSNDITFSRKQRKTDLDNNIL